MVVFLRSNSLVVDVVLEETGVWSMRSNSLALRYPERVSIKFWWLCVPHVGRCDGNQMAGIPPAFMGAKNRVVTSIRDINTHSNRSVILLSLPRAPAHIP